MRLLGFIENEAGAERFIAYIDTMGISAKSELEDGRWSIWVHDEDKVDDARRELELFLEAPDGEPYLAIQRSMEATADAQQKLDEAERRAAQHTVESRRSIWSVSYRASPLMTSIMVATAFISLFTWFGKPDEDGIGATIQEQLLFANPSAYDRSQDQLISVKAGELWRLITPVFLHFEFPPFLINCLVWASFAGMIERVRGSASLAILVVIIAVASNVGQALSPVVVGGGIEFGGLSAVILGLFGYVWVKSRIDGASGLYISHGNVLFIVAFFILCFSTQHIANVALIVGLFTGVSLAFLSPPTSPGTTSPQEQ